MDQDTRESNPFSTKKTAGMIKLLNLLRTFVVAAILAVTCGPEFSVAAESPQVKRRPVARPVPTARAAVEVAIPTEQASEKEEDDKKKTVDKKTDESKKSELLTQKGPFQEIKENINKLCSLGWDGGALKIKASTNYQEIDPVMDEIRAKMGYGGGSSYGGETYNFNFDGDKMSGRMAREKSGKTYVQIFEGTERKKPYRELQVKSFKDGRIQITLNAQKANYLLRIRQSKSGAFNVQELDGVDVFASNATNFENFCRQNPEFTSNRLLPTLEHFGLGTIMTPYDARVQAKVTEIVSPWADEDFNKIKELTEQLNAESYEEREAAAKALKKEMSENKDLLSRLVFDKRFTPEVRARTRMLLRSKLKDKKLAEMDFIENLASSLDAKYLIELIRRSTSPETQTALIEKLKEVSPEFAGLDSSADVSSLLVSQAVNAWASEQMSGPKENEVDVAADKGPIDEATEFVGQLVMLTWEKDYLKVDRDHWKKPFDGKEIDELSKKIEKLVKESNLPKNWYSAGGATHSRKSGQHPQVIFELMQEKLKSKDSGQVDHSHRYNNYNSYNQSNGSYDRRFALGKIDGELSFSKTPTTRRSPASSASGSLAKKPFRLLLHEKKDSLRRMTINEPKIGELQIQVVGDQSNYIVQLTLEKDRALIQDIRGSYVRAFEAKNFRELQRANPEYFRGSFFPLLRKLGVEVNTEVDAGPDASKTTDASTAKPSSVATAG